MALSKRLALLRALSVTKPRLGSSWGLINRRQSSNLTKDAKVSAEFKQWEEERSEMTAGLRRVIEKAGEESAKGFKELADATDLAAKQFCRLFTGGLVLVTASSVAGTFAVSRLRVQKSNTRDV